MKLLRRFFAVLFLAVFVLGCFLCVREPLSSFYREKIIPLQYFEIVERYSLQYDVPPSVIYAVMKCESNFDPQAVSRAGAMGLMQLMPDTFAWLSQRSGADYEGDKITQPEANVHIGVYYLSWLYERFENWELVYAAYNAGHNRVKKWLEEGSLYTEDGSLQIPIRETSRYVEKVSFYRIQYLKHYQSIMEKENEYER